MVNVNVVATFIITLILACFCVTVNMNNWAAFNFDLVSTQTTFIYFLYSFFYAVGLLSVVYSTYKNSNSEEKGMRQLDQQTYFLYFGGMAFFFAGIMTMDALNLANMTYCFKAYKELDCNMWKVAGFVLYHTTKPTYLGIQLMFMIYIRYNRLARGYTLICKIAHSINIMINIALIIKCLSYETRLLHNNEHREGNRNFFVCNVTNHSMQTRIWSSDYMDCMISNTTLLRLNRDLIDYIYPMQTEFTSLAISIMIGQAAAAVMPQKPTKLENSDTGPSRLMRVFNTIHRRFLQSSQVERTPLLRAEQPIAQIRPSGGCNVFLIIGLFISAILIVANTVGHSDMKHTLGFFLITNFLWSSSLLLASFRVLTHMRKYSTIKSSLPSSATVILVSSACAYNLYFYKLIANTDMLIRPGKETWHNLTTETKLSDSQLKWYIGMEALHTAMRLLNIIFQTLIIIRICRELAVNGCYYHLPGSVKSAIYYLLITNMSIWLWDSVVGIKQEEYIKKSYYSKNVWNSLQKAFMPGSMYFEFHTGIILAEYMIAQWYLTNVSSRRTSHFE